MPPRPPRAHPDHGFGSGRDPDPDAGAPKYELFDPVAPKVMSGTVHDVDLPIIDKDITVAEGFVVHAWTFGGTGPGPDAARPSR